MSLYVQKNIFRKIGYNLPYCLDKCIDILIGTQVIFVCIIQAEQPGFARVQIYPSILYISHSRSGILLILRILT